MRLMLLLKKLNITSHNINESIPSSDEILLFKPKIPRAIKFIREKKKRPDLNSIYEHFSKSGASNISKDTIYSIISELIKQKVLENKKSAYGDSFRIIAETDTKNSEQLTFCNINDNCDHQSNQDDSGTSIINPQPFTVDEQDVTPPPSPTNEIAPEITSNVNTLWHKTKAISRLKNTSNLYIGLKRRCPC